MSYPVLEAERDSDPRSADPQQAWITYAVRMKLDLIGRKISLADWQAMSRAQQIELHDIECETPAGCAVFAERLAATLAACSRTEPSPMGASKIAGVDAWREGNTVPSVLAGRTKLDTRTWQSLPLFARYLLVSAATKRNGEAFDQVHAEVCRLWPQEDST